jgi:aminopeptidase N
MIYDAPPPVRPAQNRPLRTLVRFGRLGCALALVVGLAACSGPGEPPYTAPNSDGPFVVGGQGIGDSYYPNDGNGGYDVAHYDLRLRYDPDDDTLTGVATITATATVNLSRFNLDLHELDVDEITVNAVAAEAYRDGDELTVTPPTGIAKGTSFTIRIAYSGEPEAYEDGAFGVGGFLHTKDGALAVGEPDVAATWFPVNDHPRDKATYTIAITAPSALAAISNGVLTGRTADGADTTWTWRVSQPMASYLAMVAVGTYRIQEATHEGKPVFLAAHASLRPEVDRQLARTPELIDFLEDRFGPYPFDAMGGVVVGDGRVEFSLENQTRPLYEYYAFGPGDDATELMVHELAHQWFGDSVSLSDWRDIWLNEGFATYAQWLWDDANTRYKAQGQFDQAYQSAPAQAWAVPPGNPGPARLFDHDAVYMRGAMTLHALRMTVGDEAFFTILRTWARERAGGNGTTDAFVALAEQVSGAQLDQLFQDWLYGTVRPPRPSSS